MDPVATHLARVVEMQTAQLDRLTYLIGQMHGVFRDELDTLDQRIVQLDEELSHYRQLGVLETTAKHDEAITGLLTLADNYDATFDVQGVRLELLENRLDSMQRTLDARTGSAA